MRTLRFLLQKEFKQIFRNKAILPIIFLAPILQLLILPLAADYEIKNINLFVVDQDRTSASKGLLSSISNSEYFILYGYGSSMREALGAIEGEKADLVLEIPQGFERTLVRELFTTFVAWIRLLFYFCLVIIYQLFPVDTRMS